jgi:arylsulfatase A-like enzyme
MELWFMSQCLSWRTLAAGAALVAGLTTSAVATEVLPKPEAPFAGVIDIDRDKSKPEWPTVATAPKGAPNVVLILLDDVGFGATSAVGGPVSTPGLEKLASEGLRYNQFHVNALCSPTRASLLSGRNDHQIGFGTVTEIGSGYPGYNAIWPKTAVPLAEVLRRNGYSTAAIGKWHNTPNRELNVTGPFDHWPTNLGFEYFYGFQTGETSQWTPRLWRGTTPVEPSATPEQGYHFTTDIANDAISWIHQHDAIARDKPFFLYFAPGATHAPHQAPQEWIDKYKGKFDQGWDKLREEIFAGEKALGVIPADTVLTPRPEELPAWDTLTAEHKKLLARQAEIYAGFLAHTDYEISRVLEAIRASGQADNTLVLYIVGDNGASAEGGPEGIDVRGPDGKQPTLEERLARVGEFGSDTFYNHYSAGWAWGFSAPFQWTKQVASHLGGTRNPLIVSWPAKITDKGAIRGGFHHVTDVAPTIYEAAGIAFPEQVDGVKQLPLEGQSFADSFTDASAKSRHTVQYFEMLGNRGIYKDGWWAGARNLEPWKLVTGDVWRSNNIGQHPWELYNLEEDYSQARNLADEHPEKLKELVELFDAEAKRNNVYPLAPVPEILSWLVSSKKSHFVYREGAGRIPFQAGPYVIGRPHVITAEVDVPASGAKGVIVAQGGQWGGYTLYINDAGHVVYETKAFSNDTGRIVSPKPISPGKAKISVDVSPGLSFTSLLAEFTDIGKLLASGGLPASARLSINGEPAGEVHLKNLAPDYHETLDVGSDLGSQVSTQYPPSVKFTGVIDTVTIDVK